MLFKERFKVDGMILVPQSMFLMTCLSLKLLMNLGVHKRFKWETKIFLRFLAKEALISYSLMEKKYYSD